MFCPLQRPDNPALSERERPRERGTDRLSFATNRPAAVDDRHISACRMLHQVGQLVTCGTVLLTRSGRREGGGRGGEERRAEKVNSSVQLVEPRWHADWSAPRTPRYGHCFPSLSLPPSLPPSPACMHHASSLCDDRTAACTTERQDTTDAQPAS